MGNTNERTISCYGHTRSEVYKQRQDFSQFSLTNLTYNWSGRSYTSDVSQQSAYSVSRPWSRISRRRWKESTLSNPFHVAKATWPVPYIEALFLPEFSVKGSVTELDFQILNPISHGAFGQVFHVQKVDTGDYYAMKILSKSKVIAESAVQQVKDEARIQSTCGHNPFIVNCPFYWQNRKTLFIVSDYVSGGELLDLCRSCRVLPEPLVQLYIAELALALDFLHNAGVIYRDLKLENILLDSDGHCQLIDFGLAKWLRYGDRTTTICGTLQYIAPEVLSREPYGHAVDWWSLGVLACCMLCGEFPEAAVDVGLPFLAAPADPASPSGPARPSDLAAPADPARPSDPTAPADPARPFDPAAPADPARPSDPTAPADPARPSDPAAPADLARPSDPVAPADPAKPSVAAAAPTGPGTPPLGLGCCSVAARDLVSRLLQRDPRKRMRSLHTLQTVAFFMNFNFCDVRAKKVRPKDLFPIQSESAAPAPEETFAFQDFDSITPTFV